MSKLTADLFIVPDGQIQPVLYRAGDEAVPGNVERAARKRGILQEDAPVKRAPRRKAMTPPENK